MTRVIINEEHFLPTKKILDSIMMFLHTLAISRLVIVAFNTIQCIYVYNVSMYVYNVCIYNVNNVSFLSMSFTVI